MAEDTSSFDTYEILQRLATGEEKAFRQTYDLYWNRIYGTVLGKLRSPYFARDVTQAVFVRVWRDRESIQSVLLFENYLCAVTRDVMLEALREVRRRVALKENGGYAYLVKSRDTSRTKDVMTKDFPVVIHKNGRHSS